MAREELQVALNRGSKPSNIIDTIRVLHLSMGGQPPELDILEIGELSEERFRGIFRLTYAGDGEVILQTRVQANSLTSARDSEQASPQGFTSSSFASLDSLLGPSMLLADAPLVVPMQLRISQVRIRGIFVLIVSLTRGITISFKNEPLESVHVSSTFDTMPPIRKHLQREIEQRLADLFREELPLLIYHHSLGQIRRLAERIPPAFRTAVAGMARSVTPPGGTSHRPSPVQRRRAQSASEPSQAGLPSSPGADPILPSRADTPPGNGDAVPPKRDQPQHHHFIYYYRRESIIHRVPSIQTICDPLTREKIDDLEKPPRPIKEELLHLWRWLTGESPSMDDHYVGRASNMSGLNDPILFAGVRPRLDSQPLIINAGSLQVDLSRETLERMRQENVLRRPSLYRATPPPRTHEGLGDDGGNRGELASGPGGRSLSALDPEEFRSVDSLILRSATSGGASSGALGKSSVVGRVGTHGRSLGAVSWGAVVLSKAVLRTSLQNTLKILRSLQEQPSPFVLFPPDKDHYPPTVCAGTAHVPPPVRLRTNSIVHRSQSYRA